MKRSKGKMDAIAHPFIPRTRRGILLRLALHLLLVISYLQYFLEFQPLSEYEWAGSPKSSDQYITSPTSALPLDLRTGISPEHHADVQTFFAMSSALHTTISFSATPTISVFATAPTHAMTTVNATADPTTDTSIKTESPDARPQPRNLVPARVALRPPLIDFLNGDATHPNGDASFRSHCEMSVYTVIYSDKTNEALSRRLWEMERGPQVAMDQFVAEGVAFRRMNLMTHQTRRSRALEFFPTLHPYPEEPDGELLEQLAAVDSVLMTRLLAARLSPHVRPHFNTVQYLTIMLSSNANTANRMFEPFDPSTLMLCSLAAWDVVNALDLTVGHQLEYPDYLWRLPGGHKNHILEDLYQIDPYIPPFWPRDSYDAPIPNSVLDRVPEEIWLRIFEALFAFEDPLRVDVAAGGKPIFEVRNRAWVIPQPAGPPGHPINRYVYTRVFMHVYDRLIRIPRLRGYVHDALFNQDYIILNEHPVNCHTPSTFLWQLNYHGGLQFLTNFEVHFSCHHFQGALLHLSRIRRLNRITFHVYLNSGFPLQWRQGAPCTPLVEALATFRGIRHLTLAFHPPNSQVHGYLYLLMTRNEDVEEEET